MIAQAMSCKTRLKFGGRNKTRPTVYQKHRSLQKRKLKYRGRRLPNARRLRKLVISFFGKNELATEALVNGGRNYNGPKVAKFLGA